MSGLSKRKKSDTEYSENSAVIKTFTRGDNTLELNPIAVLNTIDNNSIIKNNNSNANISTRIFNKPFSSNKILFNSNITISFSNKLNSDCILLNSNSKKFLQYNGAPSNIFPENSNCYDKIPGYCIHSIDQSEIKHLSKFINDNKLSYNNLKKKYIVFLVNSSSRILL